MIVDIFQTLRFEYTLYGLTLSPIKWDHWCLVKSMEIPFNSEGLVYL